MDDKEKEILKLELEIQENFEKIKDLIYPCLKPMETETSFEIEKEGKTINIDLPHLKFFADTAVFFVIDSGETFQLLQSRMIPNEVSLDNLLQLSLSNLLRDYKFELFEADYGGYALRSHPDHTSSYILIGQLWKQISQNDLKESIIICMPARDIILFAKESDYKMIQAMKETAKKVFDNNFKNLSLELIKFDYESQIMTDYEEPLVN